jgi:hypothetical protein
VYSVLTNSGFFLLYRFLLLILNCHAKFLEIVG